MSTKMNWPRCDGTPAWQALHRHFEQAGRQQDLRGSFAADPERAAKYSLQAPHVWVDLSKHLWTDETRTLLNQLAEQCQVPQQRQAMLDGDRLNTTEQRRVGHLWLRGSPVPASVGHAQALEQTRRAMLAYAEQVRNDKGIRNIVNIGIGGSDLGAQMACQALTPYTDASRQMHFVSNIDGHELDRVLALCEPDNTVFVVASKSFASLETMANAQTARQWFTDRGGKHLARHFVGLTTNLPAAHAFGIETIFGFDDWVGGRFSIWSAIGLPIAIAIGAERFEQLLAGAHDMDEHFITSPIAQNLPVQMALLDIWYRNFHGFSSRCIAPYHAHLQRLPAYLQQLEMECNGKHVDRHGQPLPFATSPVIWGEPGTNGQHAFFQMLHQGTDVTPVEFIAFERPHHPWPSHHRMLLANAVAQAQALLMGDPSAPAHRHFAGNRPSSFIVLEQLTPSSLGALIALYEHRVFVQGALWGLNSFDQWGVELGKVLAKDVDRRWSDSDYAGLDSSTEQLLRKLAPSKN
jgi:glucose-6-phosphate isomerase